MGDPKGTPLSRRLRALRRESWDRAVTLAQVSQALGLASPSAVSSYEKEISPVVPPDERLVAYARLFASARSVQDGVARLLPDAELTEPERARMRKLEAELFDLSGQVTAPESKRVGASGLLHYPDGLPVTIVGTAAPKDFLERLPEAQKLHPDYIEFLAQGDADAVVEVHGHVRAANPETDVTVLTSAVPIASPLRDGHVIVIGGGGANPWARHYIRRIGVPLGVLGPPGGPRFTGRAFRIDLTNGKPPSGVTSFAAPDNREDEPVDRSWFYRARFKGTAGMSVWGGRDDAQSVRDEEAPVLRQDVAVLARGTNPFNPASTVTLCHGLFARGTFGIVRALTDRNFRERNERYLADSFGGGAFWMLLRISSDREDDGYA
jgi:hypothetical protein